MSNSRLIEADLIEGLSFEKNFIRNSGEKNANHIIPYQDAAATRPVDGTGGTPTVSVSTLAFNALSDDRSIILTKPNSNVQGQGWSIDFNIDRANQARVLKIEFDYNVAAGTFVAGSTSTDSDIIVYLYDVTNNRLIEPSTFRLFSNSTTVADKFSGYFQTSADSLDYRLIFHVTTTSAVAFDLRVDNVIVTPSKYVFGTPITDWQTFTPTGSWNTNTTYTGRMRRVGSNAEIQYRVSLAGAPNSADLTFNLPTGLSVDTDALLTASTGNFVTVGETHIRDASPTSTFFGPAQYIGSTNVIQPGRFIDTTTPSIGATVINATTPITFVSGDSVITKISIPIQGWSSSVKLSDGFDARDVVLEARRITTNQAISSTALTRVQFNSVFKDSTAGWDSTNFQFRVPTSGDYYANLSLYLENLTAGEAYGIVVRVNNTIRLNRFIRTPATDTIVQVSGLLLDLKAGDLIDAACNSAVDTSYSIITGASTSRLQIAKLQSPQTTAQSEVVACSYRNTSGLTVSNSVSVPFTTGVPSDKLFDTHNAFNPATGVFTAPYSGIYEASICVNFASAAYTDGNLIYTGAFSPTTTLIGAYTRIKGAWTDNFGAQASGMLFTLRAGETITMIIRNTRSGGSTNLITSAADNHIHIKKVG